jgi:Na+/phosphate symporter
MWNFNRSESDWDLLAILEEWDFLNSEVQEDILASMDIEEINDTITSIVKILERRLNKSVWIEEFLTTDDKEDLEVFLENLQEAVTELIDEIKNSTNYILKDNF